MMTIDELLAANCSHQETGLADPQINQYLAMLDGWMRQDGHILKTYTFVDYYQTLAFVNAIAWMIHAQDHHPDLQVGYNRCIVKYSTHSVDEGRGGISENDFICAVKVDAIFQQAHGQP
ncbi:4a-hydroxytetrahydrobiopterin dehydratase [Noviherbaspirillum humi]|uniref:4a-hydroxytetrahydrobiopterin dehydratase n=1 Tax=Noviherbaspirillum humi TaxID=1688639 RepID=A0A239GL41_9BURK|nr:4a-hydroxytetrahydrobiopterin dehydratase [Noviherbaspirillum humi]SNS70006.1 4a-hydroxytetrahydrobiopterin dehydratase [Noviherbaspirillum humi]